MFESANLKHRVDKPVYRREAPRLRQALLEAQYDLKQLGRFPVLIVIAGVEGAGKSETVNLLNEWMDPRHIGTSAFAEPSDEERERPGEANNKYHARIKVLKTLCRALEIALERVPKKSGKRKEK